MNPPKERPILFSGPMVRALLDGSKTQTRRIVKLRDGSNPDEGSVSFYEDGTFDEVMDFSKAYPYWEPLLCPYGQPGDRLWVRETTCIAPPNFADPDDTCVTDYQGRKRYVSYKADGHSEDAMRDYGLKWTPSIHVPRWASRITLEITAVRVERLQEITEEDAKAEGVSRCHNDDYHGWLLPNREMTLCPRYAYQALWESINGPGSWDANPFVWVIEFRRLTP